VKLFARVCFVLLGASGLLGAGAASAQSKSGSQWPDQPIHIVVPLPPGSAADLVARLIGQNLNKRLHQPVVIDNRPGASGAIGAEQVARAKPDGYTFGIASTTTHVTAAILNPHLPYNPVTDFTPVTLIGTSPYMLVVNPKLPVKNIHQLIELAKKEPGKLSYSSEGQASLAHLAAKLFADMAGIKLTQIPYKSSTAAVIDVLQGRVDMQFSILATTHQFIHQGKLRALGVTTLKRNKEFPNVSTIAEQGLPGYEASLWLAMVAPAKTPPAIIARMNEVVGDILKSPKIKNILAAQEIHAESSTPAQLGARMRADFTKWSALAKKAGFAPAKK